MRKTFVAATVAGMLVAVAACGSASSTGSSAPGGGSAPAGGSATSADRDKFVGTWTGHYGCDVKTTTDDKMIVKAGSGDLDLSIAIHASASNPDTVTGTLTSSTDVNVPEQSMGGISGTAKLNLTGDTLAFHATAMGMTCGGNDYTLAKTTAPTQLAAATATPTAMPTSTSTPLPSFVGEWERHSTQVGKASTEHFALNSDGTYSIEAKFDATNTVFASSHGTYESTATTLTLTDEVAKTTNETYVLDSSGRLVIDNKPASAWTRVH
jgi:hypothetical protein